MKKLFTQPQQWLSLFFILAFMLCAGMGIRKSIQIQILPSLDEPGKQSLVEQARRAGVDLSLEKNTNQEWVIRVTAANCHSEFVTDPDFDHINLELKEGSCQMTFHVFELENEETV